MTKEKTTVKSIHGYQEYMSAYYQEQKKKGDRKDSTKQPHDENGVKRSQLLGIEIPSL